MKVLVFGASGLLGTILCQRLEAAQHEVFRFERNAKYPCRGEAEIAQAFALALQQAQPECVINLIAATNVDQCEREMGHAALLNCFIPQILRHLCRLHAVSQVLHISSDQVYSGTGPHSEQLTLPVNVYGLTKLVGEYAVLQSGGCVLRTNFFGKSLVPGRSSFSDWLVQAGRSGTTLSVFNDVWISPLGLDSLCRAILHAIDIRLAGLYNLGSSGPGITKASFAKHLFLCLDLDDGLLNFVSVDSAKLAATRPKDMRMDSSHFVLSAAFTLPSIMQEIEHEAVRYQQV